MLSEDSSFQKLVRWQRVVGRALAEWWPPLF